MQKLRVVLNLSLIMLLLIFKVEAQKKISSQGREISLKPRYVVAPNGADNNPGTPEKPFATIQKAADVAGPGDTVLVKAGLYNEHVVFRNSGTSDKPIVFTGERSPEGSWLTTLGIGIFVNTWVPAPEIGEGVYKTTDIPFNPYCLTVSGKQILRIADRHMSLDKGKLLPIEELKKIKEAYTRQKDGIGGFNLLRLPADTIVADRRGDFLHWEDIKAIYGYMDGITYIRFQNGDNPSKMNISAAPKKSAFLIDNKSNIILKNFSVCRAETSITITGEKATDNIIEECFLVNGSKRIIINNKASRNIIQNNKVTLNYYGYVGKPVKLVGNIYKVFKHTQGPNSSDDVGISINLAGPDNIIRYNHIYAGLIGISPTAVPKLQVYGNIINGMHSIGICTHRGVEGVFYENLLFDNAINVRIHHYNEPQRKPYMKRKEYYYRNFFYQPEKGGLRTTHQVFVHRVTSLPVNFENPEEEPEIRFYHNTFSGSKFQGSRMKNTILVNNICSFHSNSVYYTRTHWKLPETLEIMDYNWLTIPEKFPSEEFQPWFGKNNILSQSGYIWKLNELFTVVKESPFREQGVDLSKDFTLNGKNYKPLLGMKEGYFKGEKPDLGALQYGEKFNPWFLQELKKANFLPE